MTSKDFILNTFRAKGKADAQALQKQAKNLTGTEIIANEGRIPEWEPNKDYSSWLVGAPVKYDEQVWVLLVPHAASAISPKEDHENWSLCHTTDAFAAKKWVAPVGSYGHYMKDEVYVDDNGFIWKCLQDDTILSAADYADAWIEV